MLVTWTFWWVGKEWIFCLSSNNHERNGNFPFNNILLRNQIFMAENYFSAVFLLLQNTHIIRSLIVFAVCLWNSMLLGEFFTFFFHPHTTVLPFSWNFIVNSLELYSLTSIIIIFLSNMGWVWSSPTLNFQKIWSGTTFSRKIPSQNNN